MKARKELKYGKSIYDMNLRVVYYARVSTDSEEQLNSLENQQNFLKIILKIQNLGFLLGII